jgi:hypothetical protein
MTTKNSHSDLYQDLLIDFIQFTDRNIFLTGKAGTGKTTLLRKVRSLSAKHFALVAPTGVAAIHAGGATIHSFFQLHPHTFIPDDKAGMLAAGHVKVETPYTLAKGLRIKAEKSEILRNLELLIIDEVSMLRCDLLDAIDMVLRKVRNIDLPFGGVQLLMTGDLYQLPPVVPEQEWKLISPYYKAPYFFESKALVKSGFTTISLQYIFRQTDPEFIQILHAVRTGNLPESLLVRLNERYLPKALSPESDGTVILTTHVARAEQINTARLMALPGNEIKLAAAITGSFSENMFPADQVLRLKMGAQVMFLKNDRHRRWFNGKIGKITGYDSDNQCIHVQCDDLDEPLYVDRETWKNMEYAANRSTDSIQEKEKGSFSQFPLRLAWAITIHKSQGLTFSKAIIDAGDAFASGQVYVALSRCTSLEGIVLSSTISAQEIKTDPHLEQENLQGEDASFLLDQLFFCRREYLTLMIREAFGLTWLQKAVRLAQGALASSLKNLDHQTLQEIRSWEQTRTEMQAVSQKFIPIALKFIENLSSGHQADLGQIRFKQAVEWFTKMLNDKFYRPALRISSYVSGQPRNKHLLRELELFLKAMREGYRKFLIADFLFGGLQRQGSGDPNLIMQSVDEVLPMNLGIPEKPAERTSNPVGRIQPQTSNRKAVKGQSKRYSVELHKSGLSIEDIASARGLTVGTIVSHLSWAIQALELSINDFIPAPRLESIEADFKQFPDEKLGKLIGIFSEKYTITELQFTFSWMKGLANKEM